MVDNVVVLDYGSPEALEYLNAHGAELAAVLVEPVQSRRPELQPREFLHERPPPDRGLGHGARLRRGRHRVSAPTPAEPRRSSASAPTWRPTARSSAADSRSASSPADASTWTRSTEARGSYGDDSIPEVGVTFFAGTFVRHPLALAAARAVVDQLEESGPDLQRDLNLRTTEFASRLDAHARSVGAPVRIDPLQLLALRQLPERRPSRRACSTR